MISLSAAAPYQAYQEVDYASPTPQIQPAKRLFDLLVASLVLVFILSWLVPLIALMIRLNSTGPIFFIQKRTGQHGHVFRCFKFRTMTHQPQPGAFQQTTRNDARITRVGAILRRSNLDELPQILNVLLGDMSIVGPRPHAVGHDAQYWNQLPNYASRYAVRPGLTGLAQAMGCRGETAQLVQMKQRLRYDWFYIDHQSLWMDLMICWWTVAKMIQGDKNAW